MISNLNRENNPQLLLENIESLKGFKIAALNIVSLYKYIDQLRLYLASHPFDILALNETRLDQTISNGEINVPGYVILRRDRNRSGGGVALLIKNNITFKLLSDVNNDELEFIGIHVTRPKAKPFIVGTWYRPPGSNIEIFTKFHDLLGRLENYDMEINILGDINCDLGTAAFNHKSAALLGICNEYQLEQLIRHPTRITQYTSSQIDLFLTSNSSNFSHTGVSHIGFSDHCLIYAIRKFSAPKGIPKVILCRSFNKFNQVNFRNELSKAPWQEISNEKDPNVAWDLWTQIFVSIADKHAPLKKKRVRGVKCPWMTDSLKKQMFDRDKQKKIAIKTPTQPNWDKYKCAKNKTNNAIKSAKTNFYNSYFNENRRDIRKTWKGVNDLLGKASQTTTRISELKTNTNTYTSPKDIALELNNHFSSIGISLASVVPETSCNYQDFLLPTNHKFCLTPTSIEEVSKLLEALPTRKATGLDNISSRLLKEATPVIAPSLTNIINLSLSTGVFPDKWKYAKVFPIFKEGERSDPNNYRPISVLPVVSKLIERIVFRQLYSYFNQNNLLNESQSGFRPLHSTETALLEITDDWLSNIDDDRLNGVIFLDLKKAFDTMDHQILFDKLVSYGIAPSALQWFKSYLSNRKQKTIIDGFLSDFSGITHGIPQGSILGPLLFIIYINDLPTCNIVSRPMMYADDTTLTASAKDPITLQTIMNQDLEKVQAWLRANKLTLNVKKTKFMIIGSKFKLDQVPNDLTVKINNESLDRKFEYKSLGLHIDQYLNWSTHIQEISKKISSGISILRRLGTTLPSHTRLSMYKALILPYFDYCSTVWASISKGMSDKLQCLQNRSARVIKQANFETRSSKLLHDLNWETLVDRRARQIAVMMYKINNNLSPSYLNKMFTKTTNVHSHNLRNSTSNLYVHRPNTEAKKNSFAYRGTALWNKIPVDIRNLSSVSSFKRNWTLKGCSPEN